MKNALEVIDLYKSFEPHRSYVNCIYRHFAISQGNSMTLSELHKEILDLEVRVRAFGLTGTGPFSPYLIKSIVTKIVKIQQEIKGTLVANESINMIKKCKLS